MARTANVKVEMSPQMEEAFEQLSNKFIELTKRIEDLEKKISNVKSGDTHNHYHTHDCGGSGGCCQPAQPYSPYPPPYKVTWGTGSAGSGGVTYTVNNV